MKKLTTCITLFTFAVIATACDNSTSTEAAVQNTAAVAATSAPVASAPAANTPPPPNEMSREERRAARDAAMEASKSTQFVTAALIDPNTASADVIAAIPGMTAELAQKVVAARPLNTPTDLHAVLSGSLDEKALRDVYSAMFIKVGLNKGSEDDYKLIPTTLSPRKLAHEFEEYRPYKSLDDFSREMSKYVGAGEVDFLLRYVELD